MTFIFVKKIALLHIERALLNIIRAYSINEWPAINTFNVNQYAQAIFHCRLKIQKKKLINFIAIVNYEKFNECNGPRVEDPVFGFVFDDRYVLYWIFRQCRPTTGQFIFNDTLAPLLKIQMAH